VTLSLRFEGTLALNETRLCFAVTKETFFRIFLRFRKLTLLAISSPTKSPLAFKHRLSSLKDVRRRLVASYQPIEGIFRFLFLRWSKYHGRKLFQSQSHKKGSSELTLMGLFGKTCPMCNKAKMKSSGTIKPLRRRGPTGRRVFYGQKKVLRCPNCGYKTIEG